MPRKFEYVDEVEEINMMPLMNIIMLLIPFLLMSAQFIDIGVINAALPRQMDNGGTPPPTPPKVKKDLKLTLAVTPKGLTLITRAGHLDPGCASGQSELQYRSPSKGPTFPVANGKYNFKAAQQCLVRLKRIFKSEKRIILMISPKVEYQAVVSAMDSSRRSKDGKLLFPEVVFSPGVQ